MGLLASTPLNQVRLRFDIFSLGCTRSTICASSIRLPAYSVALVGLHGRQTLQHLNRLTRPVSFLESPLIKVFDRLESSEKLRPPSLIDSIDHLSRVNGFGPGGRATAANGWSIGPGYGLASQLWIGSALVAFQM